MLVINKDMTTSLNAHIVLANYAPWTNATIQSYGIPQDQAAETGAGASLQDIATTNFPTAGTNFSYSFPPLSLTLFTLAPAAPNLVILPPPAQPGGACVLQLQGQPGARYYVQVSTNLAVWTTVSTNLLTSNAVNLNNPVPAGGGMSFWRAVWQP